MDGVLKGIGKVQIWQQIIGGIVFSCIIPYARIRPKVA